MRRYALLAILLTGCGEDFFEVRTTGLEPAPQISALHQTLGDAAINVSFLDGVPTDPQGDFFLTFSDGSTWSGNVNGTTGVFDVTLELPTGYFLVTVHDEGRLTFNGSGYATAATWRQTRSYLDGSSVRYDMDFIVTGNRMPFNARDIELDTKVTGLITETVSALRINEEWELENEYRDTVETTYPYAGARTFEQTWTRDDFGTAPENDRTGEFDLFADGSGHGNLTWNYDHGIASRYEIDQFTDGSMAYDLEFDDPSTPFVDGLGVYSLDAAYNGNGFYLETYTDGSQLRNDYVFVFDGSTNALFRFEDPSTAASPDVDGETFYEPDGSGTGSWNRYDSSGAVVESCAYEFDSAGSITSLACD